MRKYQSSTNIHDLQPEKRMLHLHSPKGALTGLSQITVAPIGKRNSDKSGDHFKNIRNNEDIKGKDFMIKIGNHKKYEFGFGKERKRIENEGKVQNGGEYEVLKNRLHALEDRLIEIKKNYENRKNKDNTIPEKTLANKENDKFIPSWKRITIENTTPKGQDRLVVQSPKPLQEKNTNAINRMWGKEKENKNADDSAQILSQFVTQYEQKPATFSHTVSETNLLKPKIKLSPLRAKKPTPTKTISKINESQYYISSVLSSFGSEAQSTYSQICSSHIQSSYEFLSYVHNAQLKPHENLIVTKLPLSHKKLTVVFDLDETLVHCLDMKKGTKADVTLPITFPDMKQVNVGINIRPFTRECLKELSKNFEIIVFTASHENYANAIVNLLDPDHSLISHTFSREHCHKTVEGFYVKDLGVIDRKLENMLLIDNAAYSYSFHPENGVPIIPFYDNKADMELRNLVHYLKNFNGEEDVRIKNSGIMKLERYWEFSNVSELIDRLYR